ncbi:YibE/F family protein [Egicoccus halophilus]|uniref:YibE/F family protein n=1 Tax=Egicoccus halophilus TaxID=1670830 RepID=A0A8J3ACU2_9ACTN|nr:YibE/F family protein [Egicoccus halophilus]GGI04643.1 hypothetical protein GCM10011354_10120 [Egicoccus halophilus]
MESASAQSGASGTRLHRRLLQLVAALVVAAVVGTVLLWPASDELPTIPGMGTVRGTVVGVTEIDTRPDPHRDRSGRLADVVVELEEGALSGAREVVRIDRATYPEFVPGDRVVLGTVRQGDGGPPSYYLADFRRSSSLATLAALFVCLVLVVGRWHGLRSLLGLLLSFAVIVRFVVPAILAGSHPPTVALIGATLIMVATLYLTHGVSEMTTSAVIGTTAALVVTVVLGTVFIGTSRITGLTSDDAMLARLVVQGLDLQGLVLAGLIIAALGVLDDVTVSQASTVFALRDTDPGLGLRELFGRAMKVGRDHIASVVNTLFLAYAGASLTLFVLFSVGGFGVGDHLNSEAMATEIVKTIVGSIGLVLAVPLTTALASVLALRMSPEQRRAALASSGHVHTHGHGHAGTTSGDAPSEDVPNEG